MLPALKPGIDRAAAIGDRDRASRQLAANAAKPASSRGDDRGIAGVAQDIEMKQRRDAGRDEAVQQRRQIANHLVGALVADAHQDRGRGRHRLVAANARGDRRIHRGDRIARAAHDQKSDRRVPEADHRPRQGHREQREEQRQRRGERGGTRRAPPASTMPTIVAPDQPGEQRPAARERTIWHASQTSPGICLAPERGI